ncbi:MAG: DUF4231 domain-containing protein [Cyanobacteria bacterium P01_D01_bin.36]
MNNLELNRDTLPGLYQSADEASIRHQAAHFRGLLWYSLLLVVAAAIPFISSNSRIGAVISLVLFVTTLIILTYQRTSQPSAIWYNGRAVAESVKTRAWRWSMKAAPYQDDDVDPDRAFRDFVDDLKAILHQNQRLSEYFRSETGIKTAVSETMQKIRALPFSERLKIYQAQRIDNQAKWYAYKADLNRRQGKRLFIISCVLHLSAIALLTYRIFQPAANLPTEAIATAAGAILTWLEAKKHNELNASYSLAAHEIGLIKDEAQLVKTDEDLAALVLNSETAFSREHTQWVARKTD